MFKKALASTLFLLLLAGLYVVYYCFYILPKDISKYEELKKTKAPSEAKIPIEQLRTNVHKDIWHNDGIHRLHYSIYAKASHLYLLPDEDKLTLHESMESILCMFQEKLYSSIEQGPMQQLKAFHADHGTYHFNTQAFLAEKVYLHFYTLPGHMLPSHLSNKDAFLQGIAKEVSLVLSEKGPLFQAEKFKAQMVPYASF